MTIGREYPFRLHTKREKTFCSRVFFCGVHWLEVQCLCPTRKGSNAKAVSLALAPGSEEDANRIREPANSNRKRCCFGATSQPNISKSSIHRSP